MIRRSFPILQTIVGEEHWFYARAMTNLGRVQLDRGALPDAEVTFRRALAIVQKALPTGHALTARTTLDLGRTLAAQNRSAEAEPLLREAPV